MLFLNLGLQILGFLTIIYFLVFFILVYYWHEAKSSYIFVPLIYAFKFFAIGFFVVILFSLIMEFVPQLL